MELRTTPDERDLIERAVAATGTDAARRVLADRDRFELDEGAVVAWDAINARRARDLPGLHRLMERPSFARTVKEAGPYLHLFPG